MDVNPMLVRAKIMVALDGARISYLTLDDGTIQVRQGSTAVNILVRVEDVGVFVDLWALLARGVFESTELLRWIATQNHPGFGYLVWCPEPHDPAQGLVTLDYALLARDMDASEILHSVVGLAATADGLDDLVLRSFGGKRFVDS